MSTQRPDVSDEDIGMRTFQLRKTRAAQRAVEHLRHGIGEQWSSYSSREISDLEWLLGEMWAFTHRDDWDNLRFGSLKSGDVIKLLGLAAELSNHTRDTTVILGDAVSLVKARG